MRGRRGERGRGRKGENENFVFREFCIFVIVAAKINYFESIKIS